MHLPMGLPGLVPGRKAVVKDPTLVEPEVQRTVAGRMALFPVGGKRAEGVFEKGEILDGINWSGMHHLRGKGALKPWKNLLIRHRAGEEVALDQTASHAKPERKILEKL